MRRVALAALLLASCTIAQPPRVQPPELPALPTQIQSPIGTVRVQLVTNLYADSTKVWGVWYWGPMLIQVERNAPLRARWLVLFHEECHVAFDASGLAYVTPPKVQEATCDAMAAQRFQATFGR